MKKVALLVYPEFSLQEVSSLMYLFRWYYDSKTVTFSSSRDVVYSEEGIAVVPEKTFNEWNLLDYHCLVISGCSDFSKVLQDMRVFTFLNGLKNERSFPIGAICGGPLLLSMAGLLQDKKFTNSAFYEMNHTFSFIQEEYLCYESIVKDGNIITAIGDAYRRFAIEMARACGLSCSDKALLGIDDEEQTCNIAHHLPKEDMETFLHEDVPLFEDAYANIQEALT